MCTFADTHIHILFFTTVNSSTVHNDCMILFVYFSFFILNASHFKYPSSTLVSLKDY